MDNKEMKEHLDNIVNKLDILSSNKSILFNDNDIIQIKIIINNINKLFDENNLLEIAKLYDELNNYIYNINLMNNQIPDTDYLMNQLYAFGYLLQDKIKTSN